MWNPFKKIKESAATKNDVVTEPLVEREIIINKMNTAPNQIKIADKATKNPEYLILLPIVSYVNNLDNLFLFNILKSTSELSDESISWTIFEFKKHLIINLMIKNIPFYNKHHNNLWIEFKKSKASSGYMALFKSIQEHIPFIDKFECSTDLIDTRALYEVVYEWFFNSAGEESTEILGSFKLYTLPNYMRYDYLESQNEYLLKAYHRNDLVIPEFHNFVQVLIEWIREYSILLDQNIKDKEEALNNKYSAYRDQLEIIKKNSRFSDDDDPMQENKDMIAIGEERILPLESIHSEDNNDANE